MRQQNALGPLLWVTANSLLSRDDCLDAQTLTCTAKKMGFFGAHPM